MPQPIAGHHFISLSDLRSMPVDKHAKYYGQFVPTNVITWEHECIPECDGYEYPSEIYGIFTD